MSNPTNETNVDPHTAEHIADESNVVPPSAGAVVDKVDDHTPVSPNPPPATVDPSNGDGKLKPLYEMIEGLANSVNALTDVVAGLVKDEKVTNHVPWTHRGGRNV